MYSEEKTTIYTLFKKQNYFLNKKIIVNGWVKAFRSNRFLIINDGSTSKNLQIIINKNLFSTDIVKKIIIGACLQINGCLVESPGLDQNIEIVAQKICFFSKTSSIDVNNTILQPKHHSLKKLRTQSHFRWRTNIFSTIMRIRHSLSYFIHDFLHKHQFINIHTPIITSIDSEGVGELFIVTTKHTNTKKEDYYFFNKPVYLTVSGQLQAETAALGLNKVYTFGPVFRAENSNTYRHLSEFWMVELEMVFYDLEDNMNFAEYLLKNILNYILKECVDDLYILNNYLIKHELFNNNFLYNNLLKCLELVVNTDFERISYSDAIEILTLHKEKINNLQFLKWGMDLHSDHEKFLVDKYFKKPVIVYNYPLQIKPFYMYLNQDGLTVKAMDVLFPFIGEIIGGSERETRYDVLLKQIDNKMINKEKLWWYIETRKIGSAPHSGFGLGFDRLVQFVTGMSNIRDVIPYSRTPNNIEF